MRKSFLLGASVLALGLSLAMGHVDNAWAKGKKKAAAAKTTKKEAPKADTKAVTELMGADRVIFGSDWPHIEGMPQPLDYAVEIKELDAQSQRKILKDNAEFLNARQPA